MHRRRFLKCIAAPAGFVAVHDGVEAVSAVRDARQGSSAAPGESADPQIRHLRTIEIDESVEPALSFVLDGD